MTAAQRIALRWLALGALIVSCRASLPAPTLPLTRTAEAPFRATAPAPLPPLAHEAPTVERFTLSNGMLVYLLHDASIPVSTVRFVNRRGGDDDPRDPPGLAALVAGLLGRAIPSSDTQVTHEASTFTLEALSGDLPYAIRDLSDAILLPDLRAEDFDRQRVRMVDARRRAFNYNVLAFELASAGIFGTQHLYGRPLGGLIPALEAMRFEEVLAFHHTRYVATESALIIAGSVQRVRVQDSFETLFGRWTPYSAPERPNAPAPTARTAPRVDFVVHRSSQARITIALPGVGRESADYADVQIAATILGGLFSSRINLGLREDLNASYGAHAGLAANRDQGLVWLTGAVETERALEALRRLLAEVARLRAEPVTPEELTAARQRWLLTSSAGDPTLDSLTERFIAGTSDEDEARIIARVAALTPRDVQTIATRYLDPARAHFVIVGTRDALESGLRRMNLGEIRFLEVRLQ